MEKSRREMARDGQDVQCVKCNVKIAWIVVKQVYKVGLYICENCFNRLDGMRDKVVKKEVVE